MLMIVERYIKRTWKRVCQGVSELPDLLLSTLTALASV